ncbi:MAG: hypothetical protein QNJ68_19955 [Microcoleaceae cyanobacterium MO_207.B10]|nr:hypothetical protein [Microcoleaceae cyanobacterium MO_207.B10]
MNMSTENNLPEHYPFRDDFSEQNTAEREQNSNLENSQQAVRDESNRKINQTRLLLTLWDLGCEGEKIKGVKKSELTSRVKRKKGGKKIGKYQDIYEDLEKVGAIIIETKNRAVLVYITEIGQQMLGVGLQDQDFNFEGTVIATRLANALLRWNRKTGSIRSVEVELGEKAIADYEEFKQVVLTVYERLNSDYNYDNLVPIYRIRRDIGERVSRSQFNQWMLEMQADDIIVLQGGSVEDSAPDKIEDSISTEIGGLRCFARKLL